MKKIKSPWYGIAWIIIWTVALAWFLTSGMFDSRESVGLIFVWIVLVGITVFLLVQDIRARKGHTKRSTESSPDGTSLNAPCPCGSGKKYKRCCGAETGRGR